MALDKRVKKQIVIGGVFSFIVVSVAVLAWFMFFYKSASCQDGVWNQNEVDIDCGGECAACVGRPQPVSIQDKVFFIAAENQTFDVLFKVKNPNPQWGVKSLPYTVSLEDTDGKILAERAGSTFLLLFEEQSVVESAIKLSRPGTPFNVRVVLGAPLWVEVPDNADNNQLVVLNLTFTGLRGGPDVAEVRGIIRNDSPFAYDRVVVSVVVSDENGSVVGLRRTEIRTLSSGQRREFRVAWRTPLIFGGEPKVQAVALTNVFENANFILEHGGVERFQELH